ncbi:valine--pyruvate transaminase [Aliagarivorans taiwanensis]|uniref:valine--pyruvate transaminase n=1 Tax=Aliagarivorans taiwanensis TaxID=561966 RepID=UPI000415100A|nr:valine--pyruvate transaminase [Aliagarivorans taiwanensis]
MYSKFGEKFTKHAGITQLMSDLDEGLRAGDNMLMLGGGNPADIPALKSEFAKHLNQGLGDGSLLSALCNYDSPQGNQAFIESLAALLKNQFGWDLSANNIALTNGSQSAFFYLFNLFAGESSNGHKKVLFPLAPEYIGYEDSGLTEDLFCSYKPTIEYLPERQFKYHIDFDQLSIDDDIGLICVSRPTNPTGNVITDDELAKLDELARAHQIPLLIDNAYGLPFPSIVFSDATPFWNDNTILCLSLSKLGLPGTRCGIVIANPGIIAAMGNLSGIINLAPGGIGPAIARLMIEDGSLLSLSKEVIAPFYQQRAQRTLQALQQAIPSTHFRIHKPEGAMFLWLWFEDLAISSQMLYERLKERGLLIVPGSYFFPGIDKTWPHTQQCIRLNYAAKTEVVDRAIAILAETVNPLLPD